MLQAIGQFPRRIVMTLDAVGGVWRYALDLASALRPAGIEVLFVGFGPEPSVAQRREAESLGRLVWPGAPLDWTAGAETELDTIPGLLSDLAARHDIDLVHLNLPSQGCGLHLQCPVVVVSHSCVATWFAAVRGSSVPRDWAWQVRRNREGFAHADAIIAPSRSHALALDEAYGRLDRIVVVPNGSSGAPMLGPRHLFAFAAARWWDEGKNAATLDAAAARCGWPVRMAGALSGPNGEHVRLQHAQPLGERPNVEIRHMMATAGVFVSPSLYEPFGLAALEAACAGTALVLADIDTYRENWDSAAVFVPPRDAEALARAIDGLLSDPARLDEMGRLARGRAERFSLKAQAEAMLDIYRGLMPARFSPVAAAG